jgi:pilus assembly protein CpaB
MRGNNVLILIVAIVLGGLAAFLARNWLLSRQQTVAVGTTIVVASKMLPFGTTLANDNVEVIPWAAQTLPAGAFSSKEALFKEGRRISLGTIEKGEPILNAKITGPGQRASLSTLISADMRAITIRVDDVRGVAGFILPNDHVDVVLNHSESGGAARQEYSDILLQDIKVIAVDQISSEQKDRPIVAKAVTLEVTPLQAQKISLASSIGHLSLILRRAGDSSVVVDQRVNQSDLLKREFAAAPPPPPPPPVAKKVAAKEPVKPAKEPAPPTYSRFSTVAVVRGVRNTQDYQVIREEN